MDRIHITIDWFTEMGKMKDHFVQSIQYTWTPITRISRKMTSKNTETYYLTTFSHSFSMCTDNLHRLQGLVIDDLAFDPKGIKEHGIIYTMLSRVRDK